ncbi:augmin complex subunit dgt6 isoform X2 [Eurosta solidaginis]|uniref:augmin complex subunit dgt6 isoform X2 n=1 Tax=Eurosta solidaginis TaxID=178769 RepID=UPI00353117C9
MDRTVIAVQRAEERDISEKLYKKLRGLGLLHPQTEDLRKHLNQDMFIKPNPQAFFHVMHYLFCLLDPIEFRKRFYWPITDKRSEANFRTSTVEYLKYLNEKHKLHWGDIKSYLVVMPGGKKFILFLLELVAFVVQEQIRQREKLLGSEVEAGNMADLNLKRMRKQNAFLKCYTSDYISNVDEQIVQFRDKTQQLKLIFDALVEDTGVDKAQLYSNQFIALFEKSNRDLFQDNYVKDTSMLRNLERPCAVLTDLIEKFQIKESELKYDKGRVSQALRKISDAVPEENTDNLDDVKLDELISAFNKIQPILENAFSEVEQTRSCGDLITAELTSLKDEFQQIEAQITAFQMSLVTQMKTRSTQHKQIENENSNSLMLKYICTPPIKLDSLNCGRMDNMRLPLFNDIPAKFATDSFSGNVSVLPRSARKHLHAKDNSMDINITMNKSRIIDSTQLLRTIHKGTARAQRKINNNLSISSTSLLSTSWRERQNMFHNDLVSEPIATKTDTSVKSHTSVNLINTNDQLDGTDVTKGIHGSEQCRSSTSPYTPFNSNERTRIARNQLLEAISSSSGSGSGTKTKLFYTRRLSALQKVQGDSLNITNMSTSPSGRLDPLVPISIEYNETPKLMLNDITMQDKSLPFNNTNERMTAIQQMEVSSDCGLITGDHQIVPQSNDENDQNINNNSLDSQTMKCVTRTPHVKVNDYDDDLFNISDTVLKDVTM